MSRKIHFCVWKFKGKQHDHQEKSHNNINPKRTVYTKDHRNTNGACVILGGFSLRRNMVLMFSRQNHRSYRATKEKWSPGSRGGSQASTSKCNWVRRLRTRPVIKGQYLWTPPAWAKIRCQQRVFPCKNSTHLHCFAHLLCNCFCHGHNPFSKLCWLETVKWFHQVSQKLTLMWPWEWLLSSLHRHARLSNLCFPLWRHQIGSRGPRFCIKPSWPFLKILIY